MHFCSQCRQLNISLSNFLSHPGLDTNPRLDDPIFSFGSLAGIIRRSEMCRLCRLVYAALWNGPLQKFIRNTSLNNITVRGTWINTLGPRKEQRLKGSTLCILIWPEAQYISPMEYKMTIRAVSPKISWYPHFGRLIKHSYMDYDLIKSWLHQCESEHNSCRRAVETSGRKPTETFMVIDVKNNCIVVAPDHCRYLALSYVWGSATQLILNGNNFLGLTRPNGLSGQPIPRMISDAMLLTSKLDEQYLWVDSLCIIQDSYAVRQRTIEDMDQIYLQSLLTIVAATCTNADDRMPGVTLPRSPRQFYEEISPNLTLSAHFDFKDYLKGSVYSSRAWTFQEQQLATRLLIFANNDQIYFACKDAVFSEGVVPEQLPGADHPMMAGAEMIKLNLDSAHLWYTYHSTVKSFTARRMTNEQDIINAFSGVLRVMSKDSKLEGIPTSIFDIVLLWQPQQRVRRRTGFASWSWAGWCGQVDWYDDRSLHEDEEPGKPQQVNDWLKKRNWIVWYSSWGSDMKEKSLSEDIQWLRGYPPSASDHHERFPDHPNQFLPTSGLLRGRLEKWGKQRPNSRYLQFWTMSVLYWIKPLRGGHCRHAVQYRNSDSKTSADGNYVFVLLNKHHEQCGWVLLDENWLAYASKVQEFIILSEGRYRMDGWRPHENHLYWTDYGDDFGEFNAMMVVWEGGIAERAGMGRVMKKALVDSCGRGMKWKEILLG